VAHSNWYASRVANVRPSVLSNVPPSPFINDTGLKDYRRTIAQLDSKAYVDLYCQIQFVDLKENARHIFVWDGTDCLRAQHL
jgi:hypothetical protein